jgi:hypothetical protein
MNWLSFEKEPGEVQDCREITDHFGGIYPNLIKLKDVNM